MLKFKIEEKLNQLLRYLAATLGSLRYSFRPVTNEI